MIIDSWQTLLWTWVAGFLTLCIFSFLYKDNPFYKFAEHVYVGVSAGYWITTQYDQVINQLLLVKLNYAWQGYRTTGHIWWEWHYLIAAALGIMMVLRLFPRLSWLSRWSLAFVVGMASGYSIVITMDAAILEQIRATMVKLFGNPDGVTALQHWLVFIGVLTGLVYFYFSKEHSGPVMKPASRIGIYFIMITLGSAFGYTVMARVSLLFGRMSFIIDDWIRGTIAFLSHHR